MEAPFQMNSTKRGCDPGSVSGVSLESTNLLLPSSKILLASKGDDLKGNAWLRCEVRPGMFENEVAICITTADDTVISFFIPTEFVKSFSRTEKAISVEVVDRNADFGVVTLPRRTFEGSNVARVPVRALRFA